MIKPPDQQTFPQTAINITPDGLVVSVQLAPGTSINQLIPAETLNQICAKWAEMQQQKKNEMAIIDLVQRSKNR